MLSDMTTYRSKASDLGHAQFVMPSCSGRQTQILGGCRGRSLVNLTRP